VKRVRNPNADKMLAMLQSPVVETYASNICRGCPPPGGMPTGTGPKVPGPTRCGATRDPLSWRRALKGHTSATLGPVQNGRHRPKHR